MTRKTRLILLSGILVVTVGAAVGVSLSEKAREDIRESGEVVFELPADTATAVSWTYTDEDGGTVSLSFRKDGDWLYDGDEAFPVDAEKLQELLDQFARDLTRLAAGGMLDPVVGREAEISRVIQILSRRQKNNPALIGVISLLSPG